MDVVVREGSAVFELLAGEDQALLIRRNAFLVLDLCLDVIDSVARFNLKSDGLAGNWKELLLAVEVCGGKAILKSGVNLRVFTKICMMIGWIDL